MKSPGKKTILITGATGFIGSNFINTLSESEYDIIGIKHRVESVPRIKIIRKVDWLTISLQKIPRDILRSVDAVVHLASHSANHPYDTLYNCVSQNVLDHIEFIENAYQSGVKRFVLAGSCFEYGDSGEKYEYIPTNAPLEPRGTYPVSKVMFFLAVRELFKGKEVIVTYQRIFQVFGEGEAESRFWPTLKKKALSGEDMAMTYGEQVRDFINVSEVAFRLKHKLQRIIESNKSSFEIENLASGNPMTLKEFSEFWWAKWDAQGKLLFGTLPYREDEVMRFVPKILNNK